MMERLETSDGLFAEPAARRRRRERTLRALPPASCEMRVYDLPDALRDGRVRATWQRLFSYRNDPSALFASPAWAEYLKARGVAVRVAIVRRASGAVAGVVPMVCHQHALSYTLGERRVSQSRLRVAHVLGSTPLVPEDAALPSELVRGLLDANTDCDAIHVESLPTDDPYAWVDSPRVLAYRPLPERLDHVIRMEGTFSTYARGMSGKLRSNVERSLRALGSFGTVEIHCYREPADVDRLFTDASQVRARSWQHESLGPLKKDPIHGSYDSLAELSRRDLLRGYVLYAGGAPCAFVIGYQHRGIYSYANVGYDAEFGRHSPGSVLLYLMLEDLFTRDRPRFLSFGRGDDDYKRRFANSEREVTTQLYFRPTLRNKLRVQKHRLFVQAKDLVGPRRPSLALTAGRG